MNFKLGETGDIIIEENELVTYSGNKELIDRLKEELLTWKTTWFANIEYGVDWFTITDTKVGATKLTYEVTKIIKKYDFIKKISKFDIIANVERRYSIRLELILNNDSKEVVEV